MMRSLSSGVAGLRTHQTKMDVIGNNIANVNTFGFKASRTTFADVYYQNLGGASSGELGVRGGQNPTQIGYGSSVATIDVMNSVSGASSTDRALDVYLAGDGFIAVKDQNGKVNYTRFGNLGFDAAGNLVDGNGNRVQGFPLKEDRSANISPDGTIAQSDLIDINCPTDILDKLTGISISPNGAIVGIMEGDKIIKLATSLPPCLKTYAQDTSIAPDSNYVGDIHMTIGALPTADDLNDDLNTAFTTDLGVSDLFAGVEYGDVGLPTAPPATYTMEVDTNGRFSLKVVDAVTPKNTNTYSGYVDANGKLVLKSSTTSGVAMTLQVDPAKLPLTKPSSVVTATIETGMDKLKYQVTTRDAGENKITLPADGPKELPAPNQGRQQLDLEGIALYIDTDIQINPFSMSVGTATPDENVLYPIGHLAFAKFRNPNGMESSGSSYFGETANSGSPVFVKPGSNGTGTTKSGYLEMSNVDVSKEMTDMITTQRGFQASSRIITVSDTMLEELVNLKR